MQGSDEIKILCVGPKGSGKTMLMKKLQNVEGIDNTYNSVPTVGTNIYEINYVNKSGKKLTKKVREVGGEMSLMWYNYLNDIQKVIFVVDTSNLCQISAAAVLLYKILAEPMLKKAQFLIVLTKMDVAYRQMRNEALLMLQYKRLKCEVPQTITVIETSAINGEGIDELKEFITGVKINNTPF